MGLKIEKNLTGTAASVTLGGRLDTGTAPELEKELEPLLSEAQTLRLDLGGLEYISSAGLRVLLKAQKAMSQKGGMTLRHVPEGVREVFDITGFADFLSIEN